MAANLKTLRTRIKSVKSTQKITKAMKMVAASKLKRAQERCEAARPYTEKMEQVLGALAGNTNDLENAPKLLVGTGKAERHLMVVMTSDRGLCGAFNGSVVRAAKRKAETLIQANKKVTFIVVGKKGYDQLKHGFKDMITDRQELGKKQVEYADASKVAEKVLELFEQGAFDVCTVVYNKFKSAISQVVTFQQLIPLDVAALKATMTEQKNTGAVYDYEPAEEVVLSDLLPRNIAVQLFRALLESAASEQGARMSAMDSATRNAGEMIKKLTLVYNRSRQATITKELIEIISGAEAI